jgi:hypothetical protein
VNPYAGPATDYYILFRDTEVPVLTDSDYGKRSVQEDLLIADKAAYVWGYVGELNDGQVKMIQERLDGFYEEGFKEEFRLSHTDIPSSHGFEITIVVRLHVALKALAEISPDLEFISRNSPFRRFWFFPKTDAESMRIKQVLSSLPDEKKPSIRWNMYEVEFPQKHRSFVRLLPSTTLMDGLERVGYGAPMNLARHTAAIWIIDTALSTSMPMRKLSPVKAKHSQLDTKAPQHPLILDRPKFDGAAFLKVVNNDMAYILALTERQLEVFEKGVMIANNIRTAFNCGYRNIENKYEAIRTNRALESKARIHDSTIEVINKISELKDHIDKILPVVSADNPDPVPKKGATETGLANNAKTTKQLAAEKKPKEKTPQTRNSGKEYEGRKMAAVNYAIEHPGVTKMLIESKYELTEKTLSREPLKSMIKKGRELTINPKKAISKNEEIEFRANNKPADTKRKRRKPLTKEEIESKKLDKLADELMQQAENTKKSAKTPGKVR